MNTPHYKCNYASPYGKTFYYANIKEKTNGPTEDDNIIYHQTLYTHGIFQNTHICKDFS